MNWGTFHVEPIFKEVWERANRCLKQRNFALQSKGSGGNELASWTDGLIKNTLQIDEYRTGISKTFPRFFPRSLRELVDWKTLSFIIFADGMRRAI